MTAPPAALASQSDRVRSPRHLVLALGITQTVGYGAMSMAIVVLITPMARDLGVSTASIALGTTIEVLLGAAAAVPVGRMLDRFGGRWVMAAGSLLGVLAMLGWSQVTNLTQYYALVALIGVAIGASTYEAAFAVIVTSTRPLARDATILRLTLITAFTSAFYYPLTGWLEAWLGWRATVAVLGCLMAVAIPLHLWVVPGHRVHRARAASRPGVPVAAALRETGFWLLSTAFVLEAAAGAGVMIILVSYLRQAGHPATTAATLPLLIGVLAVPIRLLLGLLARRWGMTLVSAAGFVVQAAGAALLWRLPASLGWAALGIAGFGFGVGVATIARPAILAGRYGAASYGTITAAMMVPVSLARAGAPLLATSMPAGTFMVVAAVLPAIAAGILIAVWQSAIQPDLTAA
jgi:predicted MFS family arabinose efflux permease